MYIVGLRSNSARAKLKFAHALNDFAVNAANAASMLFRADNIAFQFGIKFTDINSREVTHVKSSYPTAVPAVLD